MGDRRPSFFRSLLSSATASRRKPAATRPAEASATASPAAEPKNTSKKTVTSTVAPAAESKNDGQSTSDVTTTTTVPTPLATGDLPAMASLPLRSEAQKSEQAQPAHPPSSKLPSTKEQMATKNNQPKKSSPSHVTTPSPRPHRMPQSKSPPQSSSPSKLQSKSPPQATSPSKPPPRARATPSSPSHLPSSQTPSTPKRPPQPRSPNQTSNSSKGVKPSSPSKDLKSSTKEEITSYHEAPTSTSTNEGTKAAASQTEEGPQPKADIKTGSKNDFIDTGKKPNKEDSQPKAEIKSDSGKGFNDIRTKPSNLPELENTTTTAPYPEKTTPKEEFESPTINKEHKPSMEINDKAKEIKEVKEVVQELDNESNAESKKEMNDPHPPKSYPAEEITEKGEVPEPDKLQTERKVDSKEAALSVPPNAKSVHTAREPKRSRIAATQNKSTLPGGEHAALSKDIMGDISTFVNRMPVGDPKGAFPDRPISIITLAGENRGASMQMGSNSSQEEGTIHIHRGYKINPDESADAMSDGDGNSEGMNSEDAKAAEDQPEAYVNNNAQGVNNSIVFNSSITERNPGVHMAITHVPKEPIQSTGKTNPMIQKAAFNLAHTVKHTYEPTVRRRCLRGLFLESSDSDTENPEKPRRHGCRVGCQQQPEKGGNNNVAST